MRSVWIVPIVASALGSVALMGAPAQAATSTYYATSATASSVYQGARGQQAWSTWQATGAPNVKVCGDDKNAWATDKAIGISTLVVGFAKAVKPVEIDVWSSNVPRSLVKVEANVGTVRNPIWVTVLSRGPRDPLGTGATCLQSGADRVVPHRIKKGVTGVTMPSRAVVQLRLTVNEITDYAGEVDAVALVG